VRIRPPAEPGASVSAEARSATVVRLYGRAARAEEDPTCTDSAFDAVEGPGASQADVYAHVQPLVTAVAAGRNACVLAFGQTASGKTHTMLGPSPPARGRASAANGERSEEEGIIPRALAELLAARRTAEARGEAMRIECSYLQAGPRAPLAPRKRGVPRLGRAPRIARDARAPPRPQAVA